ncbi:MAG: dephospho-CoA kinase [Deltaproteobacteria bacterium]|nr:dephospho-CoA kinase [Deltaproteobacteria bacterium]MBF0526474.1 dephospho-CoA kinase [Deltaproteobacteria bacterium]
MLIIGLTGGIATGKSTVAATFKKLGAYLIDMDEISREVVAVGKPARQDLVDYFGTGVLNSDGTLNRAALGRIVFNNQEKRLVLESIIHPRVVAEEAARLACIKQNDPAALVIVDVPLLIELGIHQRMDKTVVVYAPREIQLKRILNRDGLSREEAEQRLAAQMDIEKKLSYADYVIDNSETQEQTEAQTKRLFLELKSLADK